MASRRTTVVAGKATRLLAFWIERSAPWTRRGQPRTPCHAPPPARGRSVNDSRGQFPVSPPGQVDLAGRYRRRLCFRCRSTVPINHRARGRHPAAAGPSRDIIRRVDAAHYHPDSKEHRPIHRSRPGPAHVYRAVVWDEFDTRQRPLDRAGLADEAGRCLRGPPQATGLPPKAVPDPDSSRGQIPGPAAATGTSQVVRDRPHRTIGDADQVGIRLGSGGPQ